MENGFLAPRYSRPSVTASLDRSATWPYEDGEPGFFSYARADHPTAVQVEQTLGELDGGHALLLSSGMAAVTATVLTLLRPGGTIALAEGATTGTRRSSAISSGGVCSFVEFDQTAAPPEADLVLLEAPANPLLTMPDFAAATAHPGLVVCDSTVASPLRIRPLEHGCDIVVHSATKVLSGHDDLLAGVLVTGDAALRDRLHTTRRLTGIVASADTAWLLQRGLRTLDLRLPPAGDCAFARRTPARASCGDARPLSRILLPRSPSTWPTPRRRGG